MAKTKVDAILNARRPNTVSDIRSSLGIVNFSGYFIPNLATTAEPLWKLAWNNVLIKCELWQIQTYEELRKQLAQPDQTLGYIDLSAQSE